MSTESNKAIIRRDFEEIWNKGEMSLVNELIAPDIVHHDLGASQTRRGIEGYREVVTKYRSSFPDLHFTIEVMIAEGDMVAVRWTARGTHRGDLEGIPPTNRQVVVTGIDLNRIAGGKIAESWSSWDALGLMQQLGAIPSRQ